MNMDKQQILALAESDPRISQAVSAAEQQLGNIELPPQDIAALVNMLESALQDPRAYPEIRAQAIQQGVVDPEDLPEQFDPVIILSLLVVLYRLQQRSAGAQIQQSAPQEAFARGGLAQAAQELQQAGRYGDTMLAHINPREAAILKALGGSGTINPHTGLPEFFGIKDLVKVAVPVATMFVAPYLAPMLGGSMLAAGAVAGGLGSALTGGNVLQGALMGGVGQGLGGMLGGALAPSLSSGAQNVLGSSLLGGLGAAATGQNVLRGAALGGLGTYAGQALQGVGGTGAFGQGLNQAGTTFGQMLSSGYRPKEALAGAGLSGLVSGIAAGTRPSQAAVDSARLRAGTGEPGLKLPSSTGTAPGFGAEDLGTGLKAPADALTPPTSSTPGWMNAKNLVAGATLLSSLTSAPPQVQQAVAQMSPEQQEYFNRPNISWNWDAMQRDAASAGQSLSDYMARNWNNVTSGRYDVAQPRLARGGALSQVAYLARGSGSGRDDTIDAKLSDGEYVMDAETVSMLGDGSTDEGARRLDQMRKQVRIQKGKSMSRGQFSKNAKSPLAYLKEAR